MIKKWLVVASTLIMIGSCAEIIYAEEEFEAEPGMYVNFGCYNQYDIESTIGEGLGWIVLDVQADRALLLSEEVIELKKYNNEKVETDWENCSLRKWLNGEFLDTAFDENEKSAICDSSISTKSPSEWNEEWTASAGNDTTDKIFILSYEDVQNYLSNDTCNGLATYHTEYQLGLFSDVEDVKWWMRTPGEEQTYASVMDSDFECKSEKVTEEMGVRPAFWLDLNEYQNNIFRFDILCEALDDLEAHDYETAAGLFETLGDYWYCSFWKDDSTYLYALSMRDQGSYSDALEIFEELEGYESSWIEEDLLEFYESSEEILEYYPELENPSNADLEGRECRYLIAQKAFEEQNYAEAIKLFDDLGQYKDSIAYIKSCYDQQCIYYPKANAVNAGKDKGYAGNDDIDAKDVHYPWSLGEFFITGFTEIKNRHEDCPILVKTLGDSITLRFDLQQDIDCLNGNKDLSIAKDKNGFCLEFKTEKSDIGRGTLFIRHTDFQNRTTVKSAYTDYLLATGTSGANTTVTFNEEGIYEVILCYEVNDSNLTHKLHKTNDYKIAFKFEVKNGNSMGFIFDNDSKTELQNGAEAPSGFYIDLANSHYLDINVKREVVIDSATSEKDIRFNGPANDHDSFTQEGIYTITIYNTTTDETMIKTIYVGATE